MSEQHLKGDPYCQPCYYFARSTGSCDYFIIEDKLRGCPGGEGCRARVLRKDVKKNMGSKPRWDTGLGKQLWQQGLSDAQIGKRLGVAPNTVLYQRQKYWSREPHSPPTATPPAVRPDIHQKEETELKRPMEDEVLDRLEPEEEMRDVPEQRSEPAAAFREPKNVYDILEKATNQLTGIHAICTADAILCLWNWSDPEDLKRAKSAIEYLLMKLEDNK